MVGNISNYEDIDVLRVFLRVNGKTPRKELSEELCLGEGSVKSILNLLKKQRLLKSTKKGHFLGRKGVNLKEDIDKQISKIKKVKIDFFKGLKGGAILVRNSRKEVNYKIRDIAIRNGAEAALLFEFKEKLFMPQCEQDLFDVSQLEGLFDYSNGDVLVIVFAKEIMVVERALLNVSLGLSKKLDRIFNELFN